MTEPDPDHVLKEAEAATKASRYKEALEKHVWYHENALRIERSQFGVRLSYALFEWRRLGKYYPPALAKLRSIRDASIQRMYEEGPESDLFADVAALNDVLEEPEKTVEQFRWLDANRPDVARFAYYYCWQVLVEFREYWLCGKYLNLPHDFETAMSAYEVHSRYVDSHASQESSDRIKEEMEFARQSFSHRVCSLVALLVLNDRKPEAVEYTAKAKEFLDDAELHANLDKALEGVVPERWPPVDRRLWEEDDSPDAG